MQAELRATQQELATVSQRSVLLEQSINNMQVAFNQLVSQLNPATAEPVMVQTMRNQLQALEQKYA